MAHTRAIIRPESADAIAQLKACNGGGPDISSSPARRSGGSNITPSSGYLADIGEEVFRETDLCVIFRLPQLPQHD